MPTEPPAKKAKKSQEENGEDVKPDIKPDIKPGTSDVKKDFFTTIIERRELTAKSVLKFSFNKKRVRVLSDAKDCPDNIEGVLYWMSRDQRIQDNWALLFAQRYALKLEVPLHVGFCLVPGVEDTLRHFGFMMKGLQEVERDCRELDISFHLFIGEPGEEIPKFATANKIGAIVTDFSPLREPLAWVDDVKKELSPDIPFCQVDAHNVVPCWEASPKLEYGARTIRPKITKLLSTYMTEFPPVIRHPHKASVKAEAVDWDGADSSLKIDRDIKEVDWATPGTNAGLVNLEQFIKEKLRHFNSDRNDPNKCALSNMSPWYHFGHVSVQRAMLMVKQKRSKFSESVDAYIEEGVVRRELADNFCFYNENYDNIEGTNEWAKKTLKDHKNDKREYVYSKEQLENGKTHDDLWNASQIQLLTEGKMHGFLRMYWAKKILEWTESPEQALNIAIYLNDRYSLDGRDPNGFVGCMWSICGIHDQGWAERPVFGKIRFMNYNGCKRKFDVATFVRRYKAKPVMGGKSIAAAFQKGKK